MTDTINALAEKAVNGDLAVWLVLLVISMSDEITGVEQRKG